MPKAIGGNAYYYTHEAAKAAGISKATLLRWIDAELIKDSVKRDRHGWRLFSEMEIQAIKHFSEQGK